ncbi:mannitol dehydrogenase [Marinicaulis flavus]|uniref:Mannitol dehydrogenase n=1 Tax=Hyphococcus luteus TaxID=2058213 RepID=A0A2S7KBD5_9PROT|nr:mannitol dehydrogenase [Marinicaulis flavus]
MSGDVTRPAFDRAAAAIGQVHLGAGAFFKAHLAPYTQTAIEEAGGDWAVCGASLRSPDARDALEPQDNLFTVTEKDGDSAQTSLMTILKDMHVAPENPAALIGAIADPAIKIVTATITEKGYCLNPASSGLDFDHPDVKHDLENPAAPKTAIGLLAAAIHKRVAARAPLTVLSCDNLPGNGALFKNAVRDFIMEADPGATAALDEFVRFPSSMVDRITPATTDEDRREVMTRTGLFDAAAVVTEPFTQWVIEDDFVAERPQWEAGGALLAADVAPYETAKLRLLNGAHSAIAYLGYLMGCETVSDAMARPDVAAFVRALQEDEIAPTVPAPANMPLGPYIEDLAQRFRNPALKHRTWQIAMDGSQKLPQRWVKTIRAQLENSGPLNRLSLAVAAWTQYVTGVDERGTPIDVRDPMATRLKRIGAEAGGDPAEQARAFLSIREIFGTDLIQSARFTQTLENAIALLRGEGAEAAVKKVNRENAG